MWDSSNRRLGVSLGQSGKGKDKVRPITEHEGPEGEWRYRSILSSTSALDEGWVINASADLLLG